PGVQAGEDSARGAARPREAGGDPGNRRGRRTPSGGDHARDRGRLMTVLALVEPGEELSLQALTLARDLGGPVHALSIGEPGVELGAYGVETLHLVEDDRLTAYAPAAWAACLEHLIDRISPTAVVAAGTNRGNEVLAH